MRSTATRATHSSRRALLLVLPCLLLSLSIVSRAGAENWPSWRGPRGDGSSSESNLPRTWDGERGTHVRWKAELPGRGHASPVVWEDSVFVVSCREETRERILVCLDRDSGATRWERPVFSGPLETLHALNSHASGTPATDGRRIYVAFQVVDGRTIPAPNVGTPRPVTPGEMMVAAFDMQGQPVWTARPGPFISAHGFATCPVLYEDLVIVNGDHDGESFLAALHRDTGQVVWKVEREHKTRSYCTPLVRRIDGRDQLVLSGNRCIASYAPRTGERLWYVDGPTEQFVASMVYDGRLFFMTCGYPDYHVLGIDPRGTGDVTRSHVAWRSTAAHCYVPSPVVIGNYLMIADDRGTGHCFETARGEHLWKGRLSGGFNHSPVHADGLVYFAADDGVTKVVRPGATPEIVAENRLGEALQASPALSQGCIFLRGERHLFCIQAP